MPSFFTFLFLKTLLFIFFLKRFWFSHFSRKKWHACDSAAFCNVLDAISQCNEDILIPKKLNIKKLQHLRTYQKSLHLGKGILLDEKHRYNRSFQRSIYFKQITVVFMAGKRGCDSCDGEDEDDSVSHGREGWRRHPRCWIHCSFQRTRSEDSHRGSFYALQRQARQEVRQWHGDQGERVNPGTSLSTAKFNLGINFWFFIFQKWVQSKSWLLIFVEKKLMIKIKNF